MFSIHWGWVGISVWNHSWSDRDCYQELLRSHEGSSKPNQRNTTCGWSMIIASQAVFSLQPLPLTLIYKRAISRGRLRREGLAHVVVHVCVHISEGGKVNCIEAFRPCLIAWSSCYNRNAQSSYSVQAPLGKEVSKRSGGPSSPWQQSSLVVEDNNIGESIDKAPNPNFPISFPSKEVNWVAEVPCSTLHVPTKAGEGFPRI